MDKAPDAFRTISEVADELDVPQHVLRFWETRFTQIKPMKRSGGRRYYRPDDVALLRGIRHMLYGEGYTIRGVQRILREQGVKSLQRLAGLPASDKADARDVTDEAAEDLNFVEEDEEEIETEDTDDAEDEAEAAPATRMPRLDIAPLVSSRPAAVVSPPTARGGIGKDELAKLKSALDDLDACRKLLDEALQEERN